MRDEGVIKFDCRWSKADAPAGADVDQLVDYRNRLFLLNLIGVYPDGIGFGNISVRGHAGTLIISASQTGHIEKAQCQHFSTVTKYSISENWVECSGEMPASSESLTHAMIYETFHDANAVIHIHNNEQWNRLRGVVPTTDGSVPYGTPAMAAEVGRLARESSLRQERVLAMAGHEDGIISFGPSLQAAFDILGSRLKAQNDKSFI